MSFAVAAALAGATRRAGGVSIVTDGLVAEYRFDEGSGQVIDDAVVGSRSYTLGSTAGADTNDPTWVAAGLSFDGADDYANRTTTPVPANDASIILVAAPAATHIGWMFSRRTAAGSPRHSMEFRSSAFYVQHPADGTGAILGSVAVGEWRMFGAEFRNSPDLLRAVIVEDGVLRQATRATTGGDLGTGDRSGIGANIATPSQFFNGVVGYLMWYDRTLSDDEYVQNYHALKAVMAARGVSLV